MSNNTFERIVKIISPYVNNKEALQTINEKTTFLKELQINSSRLVDITLDMEDEFKVAITDAEADSIDTIGAAIALVESKLKTTCACGA